MGRVLVCAVKPMKSRKQEKGKVQLGESGSLAPVSDVDHFPTSLESNLRRVNQYPAADPALQLYAMCFQTQGLFRWPYESDVLCSVVRPWRM